MREYEDLKANPRLFRKEFPRVQMDRFSEAFYPRPISMENTPSFPPYNPALEREERQNSSLTAPGMVGGCRCVNVGGCTE